MNENDSGDVTTAVAVKKLFESNYSLTEPKTRAENFGSNGWWMQRKSWARN